MCCTVGLLACTHAVRSMLLWHVLYSRAYVIRCTPSTWSLPSTRFADRRRLPPAHRSRMHYTRDGQRTRVRICTQRRGTAATHVNCYIREACKRTRNAEQEDASPRSASCRSCWLTEWSTAGRSSKLRRRGALRLDVQAAREAMALYGKLIGRAVLRSTTSHSRHRSSAELDQPSVVAQVRQRVRCRQGW